MRRVIHTAQALIDAVVEIPHLPVRGGNVMAGSYTRYAGGAVTILLAAARSGAQAVHAGSVGTGPNGDLIRTTLAADAIALSSPPVPDVDTGICFVMVESSAERTFVTTMGAERRVSTASLSTSQPASGDLVCVSGYSLLEPTVSDLLPWLESLDDVEIVLDPGAVFADLPDDVRTRALAVTTVWTSNAAEAEALAGVSDLERAPARVAAHLRERAVAVVRDGERGCAVGVGGRSAVVPGFPQTPVDTNGAGDTHTGVLCARAAAPDRPSRELSHWVDAARFANAAAAIKVTRRGPTTAPTAADVERFLEASRGSR
ncbi:MAG: PfkB family carbohydrate kinase [Dermatophilaceae bacterium]|nr:PfkB family carbohydrate kinase [Intrasporangiaceae bacterium]